MLGTLSRASQGAAEYANRSNPQRRNSRFKKVLTRKFERRAKSKGNAIKPVSPISDLHMIRFIRSASHGCSAPIQIVLQMLNCCAKAYSSKGIAALFRCNDNAGFAHNMPVVKVPKKGRNLASSTSAAAAATAGTPQTASSDEDSEDDIEDDNEQE